ncbi:MAG: ribonuclease [Proteobacteria bacterium]|nr:ribonuclease [Pseudomonadota bacterium]
MRRIAWLIVALVLAGLWFWMQPLEVEQVAPPPDAAAAGTSSGAPGPPPWRDHDDYPAFLPREAHAVLDDILRGGPFEFPRDGSTFHNREARLPARPRGYYREFTVPTPGARDRGERRIVSGGDPPREYWYSDDHYRSFRAFELARSEARP